MSKKVLPLNNKNKDNAFKINMRSNDTIAEILMYSAIGDSYWDDYSVSAKDIDREIKELPSSVKEIQLRVNSPGGSVFDGVAIYERLKQHDAKIVAYVDGIAASIASIIIMAADEIHMGEGAMLMIHKPLTMVYGNAEELERSINILDKIEEQMISIYSKRMSISRNEIAIQLSNETWFTADEAIENGLADYIVEDGEEIKAAASMIKKASWFRHRPEMVIKESKKSVEAKNVISEKLKAISAFNNKKNI